MASRPKARQWHLTIHSSRTRFAGRLNSGVRQSMDTSAKRSSAGKVKRHFGKLLSEFGFKRTKPTFWTRPNATTIDFVHLHLYTFAPSFRVHCGVRALDDPFEAIALNGPSSNGAPLNPFDFDVSESSQESCANLMAGYVRDQESWFSDQRAQQHTPVASASAGQGSSENRVRTARLLGIKE